MFKLMLVNWESFEFGDGFLGCSGFWDSLLVFSKLGFSFVTMVRLGCEIICRSIFFF